ncbi:MAG TPA: septal ring lytic transglycosylase RlpA family protein [Solirubrobacteraceae bacterium]|nr:septal ring lytic transglycosylase RlpA family protein [Solirubrobacteraceae bacterium]
MYVPAPPAQHAVALAPVDIATAAPSLASPPLGRALNTTIRVRKAKLNVLDGRHVSVAGTLSPGIAGRTVELQAMRRHGWRTVAQARTAAKGRFRLRYLPRDTGSERIRVDFAGDALGVPAHHRLGRLNVYRLAEASWYGGGGGLACGGSLTRSTLGVANKTLPCGTLVTLRYNGRSVRVPVVDRGPYVAGREFDLTEATKQAIGFGDTGEVWSTR